MKNTITFLKKFNSYNNIVMACVKITDNRALHCDSNSIEVDGLVGDDTNEYFIDFYKNLEYVEATKEEFDTLFIEATGYINELSKL